jgi:hypothetical protein
MKPKMLLVILFLSGFGLHQSHAQTVVTAAQVNGVWNEVTNEEEGVMRQITVKALGNNKLQVSFIAINNARGFSNTAKGIAVIKGNTAVYKPSDAQVNSKDPCIITLKFIDGDLMITELGECGWGRGVTAEGQYQKQVKEPGTKNLAL